MGIVFPFVYENWFESMNRIDTAVSSSTWSSVFLSLYCSQFRFSILFLSLREWRRLYWLCLVGYQFAISIGWKKIWGVVFLLSLLSRYFISLIVLIRIPASGLASTIYPLVLLWQVIFREKVSWWYLQVLMSCWEQLLLSLLGEKGWKYGWFTVFLFSLLAVNSGFGAMHK